MGEFTQLRNDIGLLLKLKLPESVAYGMVAVIQGIGLGALLLVRFGLLPGTQICHVLMT
ncbi:MAG TPA: hypothetical protein VIC51_02995 [Psychromonas sp.]